MSGKGAEVELQALCKNKDMPIEEEMDEADKGWEGKAKGMLQILWEGGFIYPVKLDYKLKGKKDPYRNIILKTSLRNLMSLQTDLINEKSLLQYHGRLLGIKLERTPKC